MFRLSFISLLFASSVITACSSEVPEGSTTEVASVTADTVFTNGRVYTVDPAMPWAQAVAVKGKKIVFVGDNTAATAFVGENTSQIDLAGKMLLPGFVDNHNHAIAGALIANGTRLETDDKDELMAMIKQHLADNPDQDPVISYGWRINVFPDSGPRKEELDALETERSVYLWAIDGHSAWVNSKALEVAGISKETADTQPPFSYYQRDEDGTPTGWIVEIPAQLEVLNKLTKVDRAYIEKGFRQWVPRFSQAGITSLFDAGIQGVPMDDGFQLYQTLENEGALPYRVQGSFYWNDPALDPVPELQRIHEQYNSELVKATKLKVNLDGDDSKHNAVYVEPYSDREGWHGEPIIPQAVLNKVLAKADALGFDSFCHCFGDGASRMFLDAVAYSIANNPARDRRHTTSHTNFLHPDDVPRFASLGVIADFQTSWAAMDPLLENISTVRLGEERVNNAFNARGVLDAGGKISLSSDWAVAGYTATYKPLDTIQVAVTRQLIVPPRKPALGGDGMRLTLEEAIRAHTMGGAYSMRMEDQVGSISVGKFADLVVLEKDLFTVDKYEISKVPIQLTMMNGKIYFRDGI
jgi:predicted amidohydrolase YtcJ